MRASFIVLGLTLFGCAARPPETVVGTPAGQIQAQVTLTQDTAPKTELRMVPPEAYMRTYLELFGGLLPSEVQERARGKDNNQLFDTWDDYVSSLGFPDYRLDIPRQSQTNALMIASFERLGVALCDRAVEHDLAAKAPPMKDRVIFAFDAISPMNDTQFAPRFDVLHRTFLGYPASLAPATRIPRYHALYNDIVANHKKADSHSRPLGPKSRFSPEQAGWAAICYGLVRHPEFHLY